MQPFPLSFCAFAIVTRLAKQLQVLWPVRTAARQRHLVVNRVSYFPKRHVTQTFVVLFFKQVTNIFVSKLALRVTFFSPSRVRVNPHRLFVVSAPIFRTYFITFFVARVPSTAGDFYTFYTAPTNVSVSKMPSNAWVTAKIKFKTLLLGFLSRAERHVCTIALGAEGVK